MYLKYLTELNEDISIYYFTLLISQNISFWTCKSLRLTTQPQLSLLIDKRSLKNTSLYKRFTTCLQFGRKLPWPIGHALSIRGCGYGAVTGTVVLFGVGLRLVILIAYVCLTLDWKLAPVVTGNNCFVVGICVSIFGCFLVACSAFDTMDVVMTFCSHCYCLCSVV